MNNWSQDIRGEQFGKHKLDWQFSLFKQFKGQQNPTKMKFKMMKKKSILHTQIVSTYLHQFPYNYIIQAVRKPFSFKLSIVSLKLTSKGMKLIPKLLALSWETLCNGRKGLSSSSLPKVQKQKMLLFFQFFDVSEQLAWEKKS